MDNKQVHPSTILDINLVMKQLSWIIEMWMNNPLVSDKNCNIVTLQSPKQTDLQGMTNKVGLTFSIGDTIPQFTIRTGATNYHI
jgi:hypothetical protein